MNNRFRMNVMDGVAFLHKVAEEVESETQMCLSWETQVLDAFRAGLHECECAIREGCDSSFLPELIDQITQHRPFTEAEAELKLLSSKLSQ